MCAVSGILKYGQGLNIKWDALSIPGFLELVEAAKKFDKATGQPDCEDPKKVEFLDYLESQLC